MSKLRIAYIASLTILGVLIALAIVRPAVAGDGYTSIAREHLIQTENAYLIKFDIINREGSDMKYTIRVTFESYDSSQDVVIPEGRTFSYAHNIGREGLKGDDIHFDIYRSGEAFPFEQVTYHLR